MKTRDCRAYELDKAIHCGFQHDGNCLLGDDNFFSNNIRVKKECDPLGCLGDLGWYCVRFGLLVYQSHLGQEKCIVKSVRALDFQLSEEGVPVDATCVVRFQQVCVCVRKMLSSSASFITGIFSS